MSQTVLLATDGSEPARSAEEYIERLLDPNEDRVVVVSVANTTRHIPSAPRKEGTQVGADPEQVRKHLLQRAETHVEEAGMRLEGSGFNVDTKVEVGDPGEEICKAIDEVGANVIAMGRRGRGALQELLLGSVSRYVVHHADCPVIIVPHE